MNRQQALTEARKRWGKNAFVAHGKCRVLGDKARSALKKNCSSYGHPKICQGNKPAREVGYLISTAFGIGKAIAGAGHSWEEAFEKARHA